MTQPPRFRDPDKPMLDQPTDARAPAAADLRDLFAILTAQWRVIAAATIVALLIAAAYLATAVTTYTSTVSILIDARSRVPVGADPGLLPYSPDALLVESQVKIIASDAVLRRVVAGQHLDQDPDFISAAPGLMSRLTGLLRRSPATTPSEDEKVTAALKTLAASIVVKRSEKTYVMDVDVSARDPLKAATLANAVAAAYIADQRGASNESARRDLALIDDRLVTLQKKVKDSETAVAQYRAANRITDANGKSIGEQELADITTDLGRARSRVAELKGKADQLHKIVASGRSPDATADAMSSPTLDKLRTQYADIARQEANLRTTLGDMHPALREVRAQSRDTQRLIADELKRFVASADNDVAAAQATERDMTQRYEAARRALDTQAQAMVRLRELDRDADASRTAYERYLRARETTSDSADTVSARVIAPALPPSGPSAPRKTAILALALAAGLFLGSGLAFARDLWRPGPETPGPSRRRFVVPHPKILASVPRFAVAPGLIEGARRLMRSRNQENREIAAAPVPVPVPSDEPRPETPFNAAVEALSTTLIDQSRHRRLRTVLITSTEIGVGKSTIASHLARAVATSGLRVLLVDGNAHRPALGALVTPEAQSRLVRLFGTLRPVYPLDTPGRGRLALAPDLETTADSKPAGAPTVEALADAYDLVVVDGPAIDEIDGADPLTAAVDSVIMVVRDQAAASRPYGDVLHARNISPRKFTGVVTSMAPQAA